MRDSAWELRNIENIKIFWSYFNEHFLILHQVRNTKSWLDYQFVFS